MGVQSVFLQRPQDHNQVAFDLTGDDAVDSRPTRRASGMTSDLLLWLLTAILATCNILLWTHQVQQRSAVVSTVSTDTRGSSSDFISARQAITYEKVAFTGGPSFHPNKSIYIPNPDPVQYVGLPSDKIDDNWDQLTWGRYILITEEEAKASWGDDVHDYWDHERGGYVAGLDMFHTLHCLGNIRKALHPEYYGAMKADKNHQLHQDHCIEQLRQYIMCSGDMTPVPTKYYPALGRNYVDSDQPHTCRNFESLRRWMVDRYEGPTAVRPQFI